MLVAERITFHAGMRTLLDAVSLSIVPGQITAIAGPNGAGKSTLLRILAGELRAHAGSVTLNGINLADTTPQWLACRRAVVSQSTALAFSFTALEVVLLGISIPGFSIADHKAIDLAQNALDRLGLAPFAQANYCVLSGGERQRVHLARAIVQLEAAARFTVEPQALLLDEPTSSQDLGHQQRAVAEIRRIAASGVAVMTVLHDLNLAAGIADELVLMTGGRIHSRGLAQNLLNETILSEVFGCEIAVHRDGHSGKPFVMPKFSTAIETKDEAAE